VGAGLAAVLAGASVFVLWPQPSQVTRENYDRIRVGMSRAEVEAILGPPGDYRTGDTEPDRDAADGQEIHVGPDDPTLYDVQVDWRGDRARVSVVLSPAGRVAIKCYTASRPVDHGSLENLLWRLRRQWRQSFHREPGP
jgi:hypothetical protein